jgi:hypothetical protein
MPNPSPSKQEIGSYTAKAGFANEFDVQEKFSRWREDADAQQWLQVIGYDVDKIKHLEARQIPPRISKKTLQAFGVTEAKIDETQTFKKADLQVRLQITVDDIVYSENLSLKRSKTTSGFNQIDKRPVDTYQRFWQFSDEVALWLKYFTGAISPEQIDGIDLDALKDKRKRRIYFPEMPEEARQQIMQFFELNKVRIVSDLLRGRGALSAEWLLVTEVNEETDTSRWLLTDINQAINFYCQGEVRESSRGSLYIGQVFMQRKGGTPDPTSLQFKINPLALFDE